jgi:protein-S-isoprenylcysteine O-methyltransferase Ste14
VHTIPSRWTRLGKCDSSVRLKIMNKNKTSFASLPLGVVGVSLILIAICDSQFVQHKGSQAMLSIGALFSLFGVIAGCLSLKWKSNPRWASVVGIIISVLPLILFGIMMITLNAMAFDQ